MESTFFHFLKQQSTVPSGSNLSFNWIILLSQSFIPANGNVFFVCRKHHLFYSEFFLLTETINEIRESLFLDGHLFFVFVRIFSKKKQLFRKWKLPFQYPSSGQWKQIFCLVEKAFFWSELFGCQQQPFLEIGVNSLRKSLLLLVDN